MLDFSAFYKDKESKQLTAVFILFLILLIVFLRSNDVTETDAEELAAVWVNRQGLTPGPTQCFETKSKLWKRCEVTVRRPDTSLELHNLNCGYFGPARMPWDPMGCHRVEERWVPDDAH